MIKVSRTVTVALVAGALALTLSAPATAATPGRVTVQSGTLRFDAGAGAGNNVRVTRSGSRVLVTDAATPLTAGSPCVRISANTASCPATAVIGLFVELGDGNDRVQVSASFPNVSGAMGVVSGPGAKIGSRNENLRGSRGNDVIIGGPGKSEIWGGEGADQLFGGGGDDALIGEGGNDQLDGGPHLNGDFGNGGAGIDKCVNVEAKVLCEL
ncbi:calcium-binding protein [Tenggerimyces flavus]|uniref:Calcium-binding protein n=1 Tax=Tenggerimyces flavus TaxID=1708749 RepID=A0ABV7YFA8_9ACTN|nr:hypothetical protein [Tenggerimyces flavus]MBM7786823.1 Ca2+-binding RTX toxin-like protein [Tenggerimyces flavus]